MSKSEASENDMRSLALTPTWSVASVLTMFVFVSLLLERSIHQLGLWLKKTDRKPLLAAVEKMKEELMLLGFISLLLTATSSIISNICIPSKFYDSAFAPCTKKEVDEETEDLQERGLLTTFFGHHSHRRVLMDLNQNTCSENSEPFVSYEGLEQLHRFIFVMAITHISYSCLTMLLAIVKIHSWRAWEDEAHLDRHNSLSAKTRAMTMQRQSTFVRLHTSTPMQRNNFFVWVTCFFRQFGSSVARADYLTLRQGFITNHNLTSTYDFHSYMIRSMEEEFQRIVGVSAPLWGFVVAFMLFNVKGSHLYFWIALIPVTLVLLVGTKLQHIIATLALESAGITGSFNRPKFRPRDELFWFKKPELLLTLIHLVLFQNSFELASFFWFWLACSRINIFKKDMPSIRSQIHHSSNWLSHKCHNFFTMDNSMTEVKVAVWLQVLLHKEPLTSLFTNNCWVCRAILVQLQHPTSVCISYTDGNELQGSSDPTQHTRHNPRMGKGSSEEEKNGRFHRRFHLPHRY
ncbi:MLO-like protein 11 isoform X2 [Salvia splendens]|uniref:MLO-like protein 11 isoform X2 n=1 Tax=Salvia splendens TaxID=180675 RepID=UPI001C27B5A7|nr:MLO-like protein 11 isoform X2 [Salvia splendens]